MHEVIHANFLLVNPSVIHENIMLISVNNQQDTAHYLHSDKIPFQ